MSRKTKISALPALPPNVDPQLKPILHAIKEALEVQVGHRGEQLDKAVTFRDLTESGMAGFRFDNNTGGHLLPITNPGDQSTPPIPHSLAANGTFTKVLLSWSGGFAHPLVAATEVFRNTTDDLLTATFIGATSAHIYVDTVEPGTTHYYWVRFRSPASVLSAFNATDGTSATTNIKVSDLISDLSDALDQSHLSTVLSTKIDTIAINGTSISTEVSNRIAAVSAENTARVAAISAEILARSTGDGTLQGNIDTVSTTVATQGTNITGNADAVSALVIRVTDNEGDITSNATDITALETTVNHGTTGVAASASGLNVLETTVSTQGTAITSNATDITALETTVNNGTTGVSATASGLSTLSTTVSTQGTATTTNATDITALETTVNHGTTGVAATASGLSSLTTTVSTQGTATTTNATDITALETTVNHGTTGVAATASGLSTLNTTVSTQGTTLSSQASSITSLNTTVGENSASITDHTASINGISAEKYVKIDVNGNVTGYGLAATATSSEFAVNAGVFRIADLSNNKVTPFTVITGAGLVVESDANGTQHTNQTKAWQLANHPTGRWFAPGTYINSAMIAEASIDVAKIHNLTVDMAQVTGVLTAAQVSAIVVTGDMIAANQSIASPTINGGVITAGTSISAPNITGGTITGSLILSGSTGKITEAAGSNYAYDLGVTMDILASSTSATTRATGIIKPFNYTSTLAPSNNLQSPTSNLWRYRREYVSPTISGSVAIENVGGNINSNGIATQTHCTVTIRVLERLGGTLLASKAFNIQSFNSGDDSTKTLNLTGSNGAFSFVLSHQYRTETGSDGYTTYYYHRMVPHTMSFTATTSSVQFNDVASTGMIAEVVISNIASSYASVGTRTVRIQDTAENDY